MRLGVMETVGCGTVCKEPLVGAHANLIEQEIDILFTVMFVEVLLVMFAMDILETEMLARQVYSPPLDVRRKLKVRLRVTTLPAMLVIPAAIFNPLTDVPLESNHITLGLGPTTRPSTTLTRQIRVYVFPAVSSPSEVIMTTGATRSGTDEQ